MPARWASFSNSVRMRRRSASAVVIPHGRPLDIQLRNALFGAGDKVRVRLREVVRRLLCRICDVRQVAHAAGLVHGDGRGGTAIELALELVTLGEPGGYAGLATNGEEGQELDLRAFSTAALISSIRR